MMKFFYAAMTGFSVIGFFSFPENPSHALFAALAVWFAFNAIIYIARDN